MLNNVKLMCFLFFQILFGVTFIHLLKSNVTSNKISFQAPLIIEKESQTKIPKLSPHVQLFDLNQTLSDQYRCIETKPLLNYIQTNICLYENEKDIFVSGSYRGKDSIWEEGGVKIILELLLRHPHLDFIDIGANVGTYAMYVAALGRFVVAIDCFRPNIQRLQRAIQLRNVANRVVLVENALYTSSGEYLRLNFNPRNVGGQGLHLVNQSQSSTNETIRQQDPYLVRTIEFNDLLPIFIDRQIRGALLKMDIEGSESFVVQSGGKIFDKIDIPYIMMEWMNVKNFPDRVKIIFDFFNQRQYEARSLSCQLLQQDKHLEWPGDICWLKKNISNFC